MVPLIYHYQNEKNREMENRRSRCHRLGRGVVMDETEAELFPKELLRKKKRIFFMTLEYAELF